MSRLTFVQGTGVARAHEQIVHSFFEADRMDEEAYSILNEKPLTPEVLARFSAAKRRAEFQYSKAQRLWSQSETPARGRRLTLVKGQSSE